MQRWFPKYFSAAMQTTKARGYSKLTLLNHVGSILVTSVLAARSALRKMLFFCIGLAHGEAVHFASVLRLAGPIVFSLTVHS